MSGSRNFCHGGSRPDSQKTAWTFFHFFFSPYFTVVYTEGSNGFIAEKTILPKDPEGVQHFPGGGGGGVQLFPGGGGGGVEGGVQMLISIETHITCDFPWGGSGLPIPPLDTHMYQYIHFHFYYYLHYLAH